MITNWDLRMCRSRQETRWFFVYYAERFLFRHRDPLFSRTCPFGPRFFSALGFAGTLHVCVLGKVMATKTRENISIIIEPITGVFMDFNKRKQYSWHQRDLAVTLSAKIRSEDGREGLFQTFQCPTTHLILGNAVDGRAGA